MDKIVLNIEKMGLLEAQSDGKVVHFRTPSGVCVLDVESAEELANNILNSIPHKKEGFRINILGDDDPPATAEGFKWKWVSVYWTGMYHGHEYELVKS